MPKLERKRSITRLARSPLSYVVLVLLGGLFAYGAVDAYGKSRLADKKLESTVSQHEKLERQKAELSRDLEYANTPFGEEKALREKFNVIREGERIIVIVPEDQEANSAESLDKEGSLFDFFRKFFGK